MIGAGHIAGIILALLFSVNIVHADWYQVEVIVFEYLYPDTDGENWYVNPLLPSLQNSASLVTEKELEQVAQDIVGRTEISREAGNMEGIDEEEIEPVPYKVLPNDRYRLEGIYRVLGLSRDYRPVYHVAWQQPAVDGNLAKAVHLQIDEDIKKPEQTGAGEIYEPAAVLFDGTVRIRSTQFLHVDIDMVYFRSPPLPAGQNGMEHSEPDTQPGKYADYVSMQETRRIRLNELHYFDHPMFGVILQVSRLETEQ